MENPELIRPSSSLSPPCALPFLGREEKEKVTGKRLHEENLAGTKGGDEERMIEGLGRW